MVKYMCLAPDKEGFDINGNSLGMQGERALYYAKDVGKHRIYRSFYPIKPYMFNGKDINKNLELLYFNNSIEVQRVCTEINDAYGGNFEVKEVKFND